MPQPPYVSRPEAEEFLAALDTALQAPATNPVVFHVWGIGGVGKSTLTRKVRETFNDAAIFADVSFGLTENVDEPIPLMAKLYEQIAVSDSWSRDPFWDKYNLYFETVHQLNTQAATGRGDATPEQVNQVKMLVQLGVDVAGEWFLSESAKKTANTVVNKGMDAAVAGLSLKDGVQQLLQQHKATRRNQELQTLMLEPLPQLTRAFVAGLCQHARQTPIILVLDTYEKAPTVVDAWLWRTLLGNTEVANYGVRLLIAGRHLIKRGEGWRKLHQDRSAVYDRTIKRFDLPQTQNYLSQIQRGDEATVERIYGVTKGLPYYLNWIREQLEKGQTLDFEQGNQEIVRLLLQGLNDTQKLLVQLAACCRRFDVSLIRYLTEQQELDFATAADEKQNCFGWLTQLSFVEPVGKYWRLDDVARDIFRQSLDQAELERVHTQLSHYFLTRSDQEVAPESAPPQKYNNLDWLVLRVDYLYHLLFTRQSNLQTEFITHLLEARYFRRDELVQIPLKATVAEFDLSDHPLLRHNVRQFLQQVRPAVEYGWAVLQEVPLDYYYNQEKRNLSKTDIDLAIQVCLGESQQLKGLAKFAALVYKSGRCSESQSSQCLQQAQEVVQSLVDPAEPDFSSSLFLWNLGSRYYRLGYQEEVITCCDKALGFKPEDYEAWSKRGHSLFELDRYEEAIVSWDKALEIEPDAYLVWSNRGAALNNLGLYQEAIGSAEKAIQMSPTNYHGWFVEGFALEKLERYEEAINSYNEAFKFNPGKFQVWHQRGLVLSRLGQFKEAIANYDKALELDSNSYHAWHYRGVALGKLGCLEEAIASWDKALEIEPDAYLVWSDRGAALNNLGLYQEAIESAEKAIQISPTNYHGWFVKGFALEELERYEEAIANYDRALELDPNSYHAWYHRGLTLGKSGHLEEAIVSWDKALEIEPDAYPAWSNRGAALNNLGLYQEAIESAEKTIQGSPADYHGWLVKGFALEKLECYEEAISNYCKALELEPNETAALSRRGEIYKFLEQHEQALADFNRTIEIDPEDSWAISYRGELYLWLQRYDDAIATFNQTLENDSDDDWTYYLRALALAKTGSDQDVGQSVPAELPSASEPALQDLTQAIQLAQANYEKDLADWQNNFDLALYHLAAGHYPDAQTLYEAGLNAAPAWTIGIAHRDLRDYLRLFPADKTASHWCDRLQK